MTRFEELVQKEMGCAVILAGSGSDELHIEKIAASLQKYGVPYEVRIASAHKQRDTLLDIVGEYDAIGGQLAYIAVAGSTDALSGTISFCSWRPTISCPPDHFNMSCITNPPGSSNAYVGRPENVGRFVAQLFASRNTVYRNTLLREISKKINELEESDELVRVKYSKQQGRNE